jgi:hypothetical protein
VNRLTLIRYALTLSLCIFAAGCAPKTTRFVVTDYRTGDIRRYHQGFDACYYWYDQQRNLHVVAHREDADDDDVSTTQLVHLHAFWIPDPGRTKAERSIINTTVSYMILTGSSGATFEGSGFFSFGENRSKTRLTGNLELSSLAPHRRLGSGEKLFQHAELSGEIVAQRNKRKGIALLNEMRHLFGPLPKYQPK